VRDCLEKKSAERVDEINPEDGSTEENISIRKIDPALPDVWRHRAGPAALSWEVFCDVARVMAPELGVANHLWNRAIAHLGCERAAVALMVLDRNRERPENPVRSVGGSLNGMLEKAKVGDLNLVGSLCGIEDRDRAKLPVTLEPSLN
jgi:replication initiation protein RepC